MYRGFNMTIAEEGFEGYEVDGIPLRKSQKARMDTLLSTFRDLDGDLIASRLTADWFPDIAAHVFISHAHVDSQLATRLAGFLSYHFDVVSFIDSTVWGSSDELLKMVDKEYCWQEESGTYDYNKRNRSTSHIHMMLSMALAKMINSCECVMFLNTPSSISSSKYINGQVTESPWIYSEIAMTSLIQKRDPSEHRVRKSIVVMDEALKVKYDVNLSHLASISGAQIKKWVDSAGTAKGGRALDVLYRMTE
jgi:hypothetical protein